MDAKSTLAEKMSKLFFLELRKEKLADLIQVNIKENIYMPIKASDIVEKLRKNEKADELSFNHFIEGMFYVLGIDEYFRFNEDYKKIISKLTESVPYIKGKIFTEIENENYIDAYILLKGLTVIEINNENFEKLISIADYLRKDNKAFSDEEMRVIEKAKEIDGATSPYVYEALVNKDQGDYQKALFCVNNYISKGGELTTDIENLKHSLKVALNYDQGKELVFECPKEALKLLIPLQDEFPEDPSICYYIAVGYRILENYQKAIFHLNEALAIDNGFIDVVNELGINYAFLGNYEKAIFYFRKAFEVTRSLEICTNLVMCYINIGDKEQAKNHIILAQKLDAKDEIVKKLAEMLKGEI